MIKLSGKDKKYFPKSTKKNIKKNHSEYLIYTSYGDIHINSEEVTHTGKFEIKILKLYRHHDIELKK